MARKEILTNLARIFTPSTEHPELDELIALFEARIATLANIFDVRNYGAAVDGETDDSQAWSDVWDAVVANHGGTIHIPPGEMVIADGLSAIKNFGAGKGVVVVQGSGSASKIRLSSLGANFAFWVGNASSVTFRDLVIVGNDDGAGGSAAEYETTTGAWMVIGSTDMINFENFWCLGLASSSALGGLYLSGSVAFRNSRFGGCVATNGGVVHLDGATGLLVENTQFVDFEYLDGIGYGKTAPLSANNKNWIRIVNPPALQGGVKPAITIRGSEFDENTTEALIYMVGTADDTFVMENCAFNGGYATFPAVKLDTLHKAIFRQVWVGLNVAAFSSFTLANVANVEVDGLIHDNGATDIVLTGTTRRLRLRDCQDVTVTNTAGALLDMDQAMPVTASAAALAPKAVTTHVTGTVNITSIVTTNFKAGDNLKLIFDGVLTFTDGNNLKLAGDFVTTADDQIVLTFDGANFYESSRSAD